MKAIILAAGMGTRLGQLTRDTPKCLLRVGSESIIERQTNALEERGIHDITVVVGFGAEQVRATLGSRVRYIHNEDYAHTNSSYSLWLAASQARDGWIHMNGDLLFSPAILDALVDCSHENALVVDTEVKETDDQEMIRTNGTFICTLRKGVPYKEAEGKTIGMARFSEQGAAVLLHRLESIIRQGERNRWFFSVIGESLADVDIFPLSTQGHPWAELDTQEDLDAARRLFR